jgi:hypothetical protein
MKNNKIHINNHEFIYTSKGEWPGITLVKVYHSYNTSDVIFELNYPIRTKITPLMVKNSIKDLIK